jgi:nucleoside-triphosphatase
MMMSGEAGIISSQPRLVLVSGESGSGKTTWCSRQVMLARRRGLGVGGFLSPGVYEGDKKVGISLIDLSSGEMRLLGSLRRREDPQAPTRKWAMDDETLAWGNRVLEGQSECDLLVIDELGPLEFLFGRGFQQAFPLIARRRFQTALVVVRPTLLDTARQAWSDFDLEVHVVESTG